MTLRKSAMRRPQALTAIRTLAETAAEMTRRGSPIRPGRVWQLEQQALHKLFSRLQESKPGGRSR
jgi:hypothetical protein